MNTAAPPEANPSAPAFQQRLGLFDATMLVAGSMIGSGIFILPSVMTRDVGSAGWLLLAWALTGLVTVSGALSYAELAAMMPHAGGQYVYLREAFGRFWAFLYGWTLFLVIQTGLIAAVAVAFAKFLGVFLPKLGIQEQAGAHILYRVPDLNLLWQLRLPWMKESLTIFEMKEFQIAGGHLVAVAVIAVLTLLNCRGLREGKWVQNLFTVAKIIALALLILVGLTVAWNPAAIKANTADWWSAIFDTVTFREVLKIVPQGGALAIAMVVGATMVYSLFASDAWNNVTFTAGETRNPRRNLPLSLLLGTGMVTLLYLLANCAYLASLPMRGDPKLDLQARTLEREAERLEASDQAAAAKAVREKEKRIIESASTEERGIAYAKDGRVATAVLERVSPGLGVMLMGLALMISTFG
ncbi:MAG TPA: amino acid permease, partial [Gemmataceae bacterium]|nr:amino acid permease [Gemmataceae bacterium]